MLNLKANKMLFEIFRELNKFVFLETNACFFTNLYRKSNIEKYSLKKLIYCWKLSIKFIHDSRKIIIKKCVVFVKAYI